MGRAGLRAAFAGRGVVGGVPRAWRVGPRFDPGGGGCGALSRDRVREDAGKVEVEDHPIDEDGYDSMGRYFGVGEPLFYVTDMYDPDLDSIYLDAVVRAKSRDGVIQMVRERFPRARFGTE